jgi:hypothetical protein
MNTNETRRVLIVGSNRSLCRHATRALCSAGYDLHSSPLERAAVVAELNDPPGMCLIDADEDPAAIRWLLDELRDHHPAIIPLVLAHEHDSFILDLVAQEQLSNLIARHGGMAAVSELIDEFELIVTCQKLFSQDIFGIEKYLPTWGIKIHSCIVKASGERQAAVGELETFLDRIDCAGAIKSSIMLVADELLMNAIFNAPRDENGNPKYAEAERRSKIILEEPEQIEFRYACDGRNVALSVKDRFGSLDRSVIVKYLRRCFANGPTEMEQKKAGAGLGLYMVFNSITQLTFNIQRNVATEVIAAFYIRSGARAFKQSGRSLNIFLIQ